MRPARGRVFLLLAALAILALGLGTLSTGLSSPLLGLSLTLPHPSAPPTPSPPALGLLLVRVSLSGVGNGTVPVGGAAVSIGSGVRGEASEVVATNSSGEAAVQLQPGNYTLTVYTTKFSAF